MHQINRDVVAALCSSEAHYRTGRTPTTARTTNRKRTVQSHSGRAVKKEGDIEYDGGSDPSGECPAISA
jgi:hypothetical protein